VWLVLGGNFDKIGFVMFSTFDDIVLYRMRRDQRIQLPHLNSNKFEFWDYFGELLVNPNAFFQSEAFCPLRNFCVHATLLIPF